MKTSIYGKLHDFTPAILFVALIMTLLVLSYFQYDNELLEKENDTLRQELNIKNGDNWEQQIKNNIEKDQPIFY